MSHLSRSCILFVIVVLVTALVPIFGCPSPGQGQSNLTSRVAELEAKVDVLEAKLAYVNVQKGMINGLKGPHFIIEGCNVHIRSGSGATEDSGELKGRGNLIIGYNEQPNAVVYGRFGSHNLVIGKKHEYSSFGGLVAGTNNATTGPASTVSGGGYNVASGDFSSVSGGQLNTATGSYCSVSGGYLNVSNGYTSTVSGGQSNTAGGGYSTVSGGYNRDAPGASDWAAGTLFEDF